MPSDPTAACLTSLEPPCSHFPSMAPEESLGQPYPSNLFEVNLKYGPLVRIGPNRLLISDSELFHRMSAPRSPYRRGPWNSTTRLTPGVDNVLSERQEGRHMS